MVVEVFIGGDGSGQTWHKCCGTAGGSTQHTYHTSALTALAVCVVVITWMKQQADVP